MGRGLILMWKHTVVDSGLELIPKITKNPCYPFVFLRSFVGTPAMQATIFAEGKYWSASYHAGVCAYVVAILNFAVSF